MSRVLLINPSWDRYVSARGRRFNRAWPPLDLLNCAALLEQHGIAADVVDARARWMDPAAMAARASQYDRVFFTSSPLDRWQCPNLEVDLLFERLGVFRHPELYVMGVHGTHYPEVLLERSPARAVIMGEPEQAVLDVARGLPLCDVRGVAWRDGERVVRNAAAPLMQLNEMPVPSFHLLDYRDYRYELVGERFALLETTRGCPYPCNFCMRDMYGGKAYRYKTPAQVAAEVEAALRAGAASGYIIDLEFTLNREFVLAVCEHLMPYRKRWTWCCQTRADRVDAEMLKAMKAAGCVLLHFGVESGSDRMLALIGKKITRAGIRRGVALAREAGIPAACFFMMGFPDETADERVRTLEFAKSLNPTYASFHVASPYPGTPLFKQRVSGEDHALYPESVLQGAELAALKNFERRAYLQYYLRWRYLVARLRETSLRQMWRQGKLLWQFVRS